RKKRLGTAFVTITMRMPLVSRAETTNAVVQTLVGLRLSARCRPKPALEGQESSTRLPGKARPVILGKGNTVKLLVVVKLPCGVSIVIEPVMASAGTVAVSC